MADLADDTQWLDATAQAELITNGDVTSGELVEAAITRIERINPQLNAVIMKWYDRARLQAAAIDDAYPDHEKSWSPFAGVPFLLKDLAAHDRGTTQSGGNIALKEAAPISEHDTTIVARFRDTGLINLGRTNSPELGSLPVTEPLAWGPTRNPWNTDHTPGGSSGGAAAAVASGMVPMAHASDGGGSIRIPASCSGLFGLKTSQGRVSLGPERDETGLSVALCVSRSVRDTAGLLDAVQGPAVGDSIVAPPPSRPYLEELGRDPGRLRIGLLDTHPVRNTLHPDCTDAVRSAATLLESLGHDVSPGFPAPLADPDFTGRFMAMWSVNMAVGIDGIGDLIGRPLTEDDVEPVNWAQAQHARRMTGVEYAEALLAVMEFRRAVRAWWEVDGWDLLLTPTLAEPPVRIGEHLATPDDPMAGMKRAAEFVGFTPPFNTTGQPAMNLPLHWNSDGLPVGVHLVAAYGREDLLLAVASQLEEAQPWADRHPPVH